MVLLGYQLFIKYYLCGAGYSQGQDRLDSCPQGDAISTEIDMILSSSYEKCLPFEHLDLSW